MPAELQQELHAVVCQTKQRSGWSVRRTLTHLGVSPTSYYRWRKAAARLKERARRRPDEIWATDLMYVVIGGRTYYLVNFLDEYSRFIVHHALVPSMDGVTVIRQTEYQYLWVLGAVCPETGHAEGLLSPQLNTKVIHAFLQLFSKTIGEDEHAVMVWDGAGFHTSRSLVVPSNITLVKLPPYSPELNPIKNLWHYLKSHYWSNHAYADYAELEQAASAAWRHAALDTELVKNICAATHLECTTSR